MNEYSWDSRTELLFGYEDIKKLRDAHILVVGLGGVGAYAAEMLCRAGVGEMTIVDGDRIQPSNRNRQLLALKSSEGEYKTILMEERLLDINPDIKIHRITEFLRDERVDEVLETPYDFVVDAIDTLSPKIYLLYKTHKKAYKLVSSMGSGGKFDWGKIEITDISKSFNCKLAYSVRKQLHKLGVREGFTVVFSPEKVDRESIRLVEGEKNKKSMVGTISYMPAAFGIALASVVIRGITGR
ncbi:MAG: tRNA threonylcarbamoyladenosine dehydratase [Bacteroidales bacterium]|nr:tRNA threonylcarbamoyladenosine dehydratase [Bacteroidales bacterium]MCF8392131.1 tRNA threonylcarbamoyladenosine dehydratase [Bacteroidales bacterium]